MRGSATANEWSSRGATSTTSQPWAQWKLRVRRQQPLDQRGAAAHHPDHDERRRDHLVGDLGVPPEPLLRPQPHPQAVHGPGAQQVLAEVIERRGGVALEEHAERLLELTRAEVVQLLLGPGARDHPVELERASRHHFRWWLRSPTWSTYIVRLSKHHRPSTWWKVSR